MKADDPRHGTYAGFQAHKNDGSDQCDPCRVANFRYVKRMKIRVKSGQRNLVPLGEDAWKVLDTYPLRAVARATSISDSKLYGYHERGPETVVNIKTRHSILTMPVMHTTIGIERRIRALTRLGYSADAIARDSGVNAATIQKWRAGPTPSWVREPTAAALIKCYDRLSMTLPPSSASATRARQLAEARCWSAPLAWDDIDRDDRPAGGDDDAVDHVLIDRILGGDGSLAKAATKAEREAVVARWGADGRSLNELERLTGWRPDRYMSREVA